MGDRKPLIQTPAHDARFNQIDAAREGLTLDQSDFLHFPWEDLDRVVRGIAPGKLWMLLGYSGIAGKTTFLTNLARQWVKRGTSVYYLPLETPSDEILRMLACLETGISHKDILTGDCLLWPDWDKKRTMIDAQLANWWAMHSAGDGEFPLYVHPADRADAGVIVEATQEASMLGCDVLILDHADHLTGDPSRGDYGVSVDVWKSLDNARKVNPRLRLLVASQLNQDEIKGDPLAKFLPPTEGGVKYGGHKREMVDGTLALYRPFRRGTTADQLKQVRNRALDPWTIVQPGEMGIEVQKHRARGDLTGRQCVLSVTDSGEVTDLPERDRYGTSYDALKTI